MNTEQLKQLENDLWSAADNLRANTDLKSSEYATPVLGLIFLKFADNKYRLAEPAINAEFAKHKDTRMEKSIADIAIEKCGSICPTMPVMTICWTCPNKPMLPKKSKKQCST